MERQRITAYLSVKNAAAAIEFYRRVFGAAEKLRLAEPGGRIQHAEITIGGAVLMLADESPEMGFLSPLSSGGARPPVFLSLIVDDTDRVYRCALEAGAISLRDPADQFYGERTAQIQDPFGHVWALCTPTEELSGTEIQERFQNLSTG